MNFQEIRSVAWQTIVEALGMSVATDAVLLVQVKTFTVADVPSAAVYPRGIVYISNEVGGSVLAFSNGTNWLRCTDRAIISV